MKTWQMGQEAAYRVEAETTASLPRCPDVYNGTHQWQMYPLFIHHSHGKMYVGVSGQE